MHTDGCGKSCRQRCHAKGSRKKLRYKGCIEIQRMWNMKWKVIPLITGATGIVTKGLKINMDAIPGKHSTDSLQKTAVLGTSHIVRKLLQSETWSLNGRDHRWFVRSTRKKRLVKRDDTTTTTTATANNNNNKFGPSYCISQCLPFSLFNKATWNTKREMACLMSVFTSPTAEIWPLPSSWQSLMYIYRTNLNSARVRKVQPLLYAIKGALVVFHHCLEVTVSGELTFWSPYTQEVFFFG